MSHNIQLILTSDFFVKIVKIDTKFFFLGKWFICKDCRQLTLARNLYYLLLPIKLIFWYWKQPLLIYLCCYQQKDSDNQRVLNVSDKCKCLLDRLQMIRCVDTWKWRLIKPFEFEINSDLKQNIINIFKKSWKITICFSCICESFSQLKHARNLL